MANIIDFVDVNVDGCGTDVHIQVEVTGKPVTDEIVAGIKKAVCEYKKECGDDWDTDSCVDAALDYLTANGYSCRGLTPDIEIKL